MMRFENIKKEYQKLSFLQIDITRKEYILHQEIMTGKSLRKITQQLL